MIEYIYHITLNSGHTRKSYPEEVHHKLYFYLHSIFRDSLNPEGVEVIDGYRLKTTQQDGQTIATLFSSSGVPILTTACSRNGDAGLWRLMHESSTVPLSTSVNQVPPGPYILDRNEIGAALHLDAMLWTGDFSRCFGWIVIAPERIKKRI